VGGCTVCVYEMKVLMLILSLHCHWYIQMRCIFLNILISLFLVRMLPDTLELTANKRSKLTCLVLNRFSMFRVSL